MPTKFGQVKYPATSGGISIEKNEFVNRTGYQMNHRSRFSIIADLFFHAKKRKIFK
jgi:hypothetical protein